jgi:hypothetical protein
MRKPTTLRKALTVAVILAVGNFYSLVGSPALAQAQKAAGELSVTGTVMINGTQAISGATVFSDSTIKTSRNSAATISLGKQGRVQLGPETDMTLTFVSGNIGGNLTAGRLVVNAPVGVTVNVSTADGVATADGKQAVTLMIDVTCGNTRVAANRSGAKVTSGSKVEAVAAGSEVAVGQAAAPRCARLSTSSQTSGLSSGALAALIIGGVGAAVGGIVAATQADDVTGASIVVSGFRP